jgi:hypothetical protein
VKGRALFLKSNVEHRGSFADALAESASRGLLAPDLARRMAEFRLKFMPAPTEGALRLKSYVHEFAHVYSRGRYILKSATVERLHNARPDIIESQPGFERAAGPFVRQAGRTAREGAQLMRKPKYSDNLYKLFDQTVFQDFHFLHPTA